MITMEDIEKYLIVEKSLRAMAEQYFDNNVRSSEDEEFVDVVFEESVYIKYSLLDYMGNLDIDTCVISYEELLSSQSFG